MNSGRRLSVLSAVVVLSLCCFGTSQAANIFVDKTLASDCTTGNYSINNRTCTGTNGKAYRTVQAAVNAMAGGDDIYLRGATYPESNIYVPPTKSGTSGKWSTMQSYPGEWAIIDGQWAANAAPHAIIYNGGAAGHDVTNVAKYWKFERLELANGGYLAGSDGGFGILWNFGPWTMRYCYVHDTRSVNGDENPHGVGGITWQDALIEYNWVRDTRSTTMTPNVANITNMASYVEYGYPSTDAYKGWKNEIRYNLVQGIATGIRTKGAIWLTTNRSGSDTTSQEFGDKIHHNIVLSTGSNAAIFYQQDYAQIYNNIVDMTGTTGAQENWSIATRRIRTHGERDIMRTVIYNNTVVNGGDAIADTHEGDGSAPAQWWVYNNILDNIRYTFSPITYGCSASWCPEYSNKAIHPLAGLNIDRNYIYRTSGTEAVYVGNSTWASGNYSYTGWETAKGGGTNMYRQAYNAANLLYQGTTGADKYRVRAAHTVEGTTRLDAAGKGGNHPYLAGVVIPTYIGATDPTDDAWVAGVLGLASTDVLKDSSPLRNNPTWVEGIPPAPVFH